MSSLISIIPRPIRDIISGPIEIADWKNSFQSAKPGSAQSAIFGTLGGGAFVLPLAERMVKAALRLGFVALGVFAVMSTGSALGVGAVLAGLISLPALAIAGGGALAGYGCASICSSLAIGSFSSLGVGLASLAAGWIVLELHDIVPFGLAEMAIINPLAETCARPLIELFAN